MTSFLELLSNQTIAQKLTSLNITSPTPVQLASIPEIFSGKDLIVEAQTGSGKTLAFALPIICSLEGQKNRNQTSALILAPTRELATQVKNVVESMTDDFSVTCLIGGDPIKKQIKSLSLDRRIVVGTPGRVLDLIQRNELSLSMVKIFVLDEADEMLSMGFIDAIKDIGRMLPREKQGLFFSATISGGVKSLSYQFLNSPKEIQIEKNQEHAPKIIHSFMRADGAVSSKLNAVHNILLRHEVESAIIFCNTKSDTELLEVFLKRRGIHAERINSDLPQKQRDNVLQQLRSGELKYLIATDIAARGIDIKGLDMVINFAVHNEVETYIHRTGRTGRAGAEGRAISIVGPQDFGAFYTIQKQLKLEMTEFVLQGLS